jgi:hypothetical protein
VLLVEGIVEGRVEKWPTLKKIERKRERRRDWQLGEKQKWLTLLHVDFSDRSLRLMTVDAWKPASSVDQFYKKGRFISDPAFGYCPNFARHSSIDEVFLLDRIFELF